MIELQRGLFPQAVIRQTTAVLADEVRVKVLRRTRAVTTVALLPFTQARTAEQLREHFIETLSHVTVRYWGRRIHRIDHSPRLMDRPAPPLHVTFRLLRSSAETHLTLVTDPAVHPPSLLLGVMASHLDQLRVRVESTNPLDRMVVSVLIEDPGVVLELLAKVMDLTGHPGELFKSNAN